MPEFNQYIGIDYSGAESPTSRLRSLQVSVAGRDDEPALEKTPADPAGRWNWTRHEIAEWIVGVANSGCRFLAGIDHAFSFPESYFRRYRLNNWDEMLEDFVEHWPTDEDDMWIDFVREKSPQRTGESDEFRITEKWTSSAKSVFRFDVQGQVAKSTHAGIPWLRRIRNEVGDRVHFWPFDGWSIPAEKSVIAEVYPSLFRNRYTGLEGTVDQKDAYATACWFQEMDGRDVLDRYFHPPLSKADLRVAKLEGWILGVT